MNLGFILGRAVSLFFDLMYALIFIRILLSWFPIDRRNPLVVILYQLTEPILGPIRALIQKSALGGRGMMLDFSPLIAVILLDIIRKIIIDLIQTYL